MKLLLSSADGSEVDGLAKILSAAGIDAEVRDGRIRKSKDVLLIGAELWLRDETDYHTAAALFKRFRKRREQLHRRRLN